MKRHLNSHFIPNPLSKEEDLTIGQMMLAAKFTVCMNPSTNTVNSIFTLPLKKEKLSHATDCNIVIKAKLPLCFIFLFIVDKIKLKIKVAFQYSIKRKKNF